MDIRMLVFIINHNFLEETRDNPTVGFKFRKDIIGTVIESNNLIQYLKMFVQTD